MKNTEKLKNLGILGSVRQRLGAKDENDNSKDVEINCMENSSLVEAWCGWHLGDGSIWTKMKNFYDILESC